MMKLIAGIGCRRGVSAAQIEAAVRDALASQALDPEALAAVASIETKADEAGLVAFCVAHALPLLTFTREQIAALDIETGASPIVREHLGIDGVCEPCARLAAQGGALLVPKRALDGVTVAVACAADHVSSNTTPTLKEPR
jgi:cobalt-precorrin 5A hydrolase